MENVGGMHLGKRENPEKKLRSIDTAYHNCHPGDTETRTRDPQQKQTSVLTARTPGKLLCTLYSNQRHKISGLFHPHNMNKKPH